MNRSAGRSGSPRRCTSTPRSTAEEMQRGGLLALQANGRGEAALLEALEALEDGRAAAAQQPGEDGWTPLHWASQDGHARLVGRLLELAAAPNARDRCGATPLMLAAFHGRSAVVRLLVARPGLDVAATNNFQASALHYAAGRGHGLVVKFLAGRSAGLDRGDRQGDTPLAWAAKAGHLEAVETLLFLGANARHNNNSSSSPLDLAEQLEHHAVVDLLLSSVGFEISVEDKYASREHLHRALRSDDVALLRGDWIVKYAKRGMALPRRQALPAADDPLWAFKDLCDLDTERGELSRKGRVLRRDQALPEVHILAISYCWRTEAHPDPEGEQLQAIAMLVEAFGATVGGCSNVAVFLDWCSLYQKESGGERQGHHQEAFERALRHASMWFAHRGTYSLMLTGGGAGRSDHGRGWPFFEQAVSSLVKDASRSLDVGYFLGEEWQLELAGKTDAERVACRTWQMVERHAKKCRLVPMTPSEFREKLESKAFADDLDRSFVARKYEQTFREVMLSASELDFSRRHWADADVSKFVAVLPYCFKLHTLNIDENQIGDAGAAAIAKQLEINETIRVLSLASNCITDVGAMAISSALRDNFDLEQVILSANQISQGVTKDIQELHANRELTINF